MWYPRPNVNDPGWTTRALLQTALIIFGPWFHIFLVFHLPLVTSRHLVHGGVLPGPLITMVGFIYSCIISNICMYVDGPWLQYTPVHTQRRITRLPITHCTYCVAHPLGHISMANFWILTDIYTVVSLWKHWAFRLLTWYIIGIKCSLFKEPFCYLKAQILTKLWQI